MPLRAAFEHDPDSMLCDLRPGRDRCRRCQMTTVKVLRHEFFNRDKWLK